MGTIIVHGPFTGPDFLVGISQNEQPYEVISNKKAVLTITGGLGNNIDYQITLKGKGFGVDENGRFTGVVHGFTVEDLSQSGTKWVGTDLTVPLSAVNTQGASSEPDSVDLLYSIDLMFSPLSWTYIGNRFDDEFSGGARADEIYGGRGNDVLSGGDGDDRIYGGKDIDTIFGGHGRDLIYGQKSTDIIDGGEGIDEIYGGIGKDRLFGGLSGDFIYGGRRGDQIHGEEGSDLLAGCNGNDLIFGGLDNDELRGNKGKELAHGGAGNDTLFGGAGKDDLSGDDGDDVLFGGKGRDVLYGDAGSDHLVGGRGHDLLSGNQSVREPDFAFDVFYFAGKFGRDAITDFEIGYDTIVFDGDIGRKNVFISVVNSDDVKIKVVYKGVQTITVEEVADQFDPDSDILFV